MKLIFTLTAGCTGTAYLAELMKWNIRDAEVYHEIQSYSSFGQDTPDISHLHAFNVQGNTQAVQQFWRCKLDKILAYDKPVYVETSHVLMKAGLVENMAELAQGHEVHFIVLKRDAMKTIESYHKRGDFKSLGNLWMRYLDPAYPGNRIAFVPLYSFQQQASALRMWYLSEIKLRTTHYQFFYGDLPHMRFHVVDIDSLNEKEKAAALFKELGLSISDISLPPAQNISHGGIAMDKREKVWLKKRISELGLYTNSDV